jgi:hypothetical protein
LEIIIGHAHVRYRSRSLHGMLFCARVAGQPIVKKLAGNGIKPVPGRYDVVMQL